MIKLRWTGPTARKVVPIPVPLRARSEQTGEVICDPIGEFSDEDAAYLLSLHGLFEIVAPPPEPVPEEIAGVSVGVYDVRASLPVRMMPNRIVDSHGRRRRFKRAGMARMQQKRYFPGEMVLREGNEWVIQPPSPVMAGGHIVEAAISLR